MAALARRLPERRLVERAQLARVQLRAFAAQFHEPYPKDVQPIARGEGASGARFGNNMKPLGAVSPFGRTSPVFSYPYERSRETLADPPHRLDAPAVPARAGSGGSGSSPQDLDDAGRAVEEHVRQPRRVEGATLLYLAVLYGIVPWLLRAADLHDLAELVLPAVFEYPGKAIAVAAVHFAIAAAFMVWRLRKARRPEPPAPQD